METCRIEAKYTVSSDEAPAGLAVGRWGGGSGGASPGISDSLLDSLHGDGERHPWKAGLEKLLDLSEQEEKAYTLFVVFAWTQVTANVLLYIDQGPFATALQDKL